MRGQWGRGGGLLALRGGIGVAEGALRRHRLRGGLAGGADRLANQLLQHRHQLFGIGMVQEKHPHIATSGGRLIEIGDGAGELGQSGGIAAQHQTVAGIHWRHLPAAAFSAALRNLGETGGNLARTGVFQGDHAHCRPILIDLARKLAHAGDIVGIVGNDYGVPGAIGRHLAFARYQRAQRLDGGGGVDEIQVEHGGLEPVTPLARRGLGGSAIGRRDPEGTPGRRGDDKAVGAQRGQEQFEIASLIERPFGDNRDFALHARIDDEGAPRGARHILDEGAHIGIAQIDRLLRQHRGGDQQDCQEGRGELAGHFLSCRGGAASAALPD